MKRSITMFVALLLTGIGSAAQEQPPAPSAQTQTEPAPPPAQTPALTPLPANPSEQTPKPVKKKPGTKAPLPGHRKVVVRNGGARDESAQLAPGMSKDQEISNREATSRLLATTDANLKSIADRQLTSAQQSQLDQIRTYVKQSKQASDAGDLARAQTLANKARLLSDELRK
jgi:hypothetical protein